MLLFHPHQEALCLVSLHFMQLASSQVALVVKNLPANAGVGVHSPKDVRDVGLIPGLGRSPEVGNGNLLQYSCLGNSMNR